MTIKNFEKTYIGSSDVAALSYKACCEEGAPLAAGLIKFGGDATYQAYIVPADCPIPDHYTLALELHGCPHSWPDGDITRHGWIWIYDDAERTFKADFGDYVRIYRSGSYGIIIQTA